MIVEPVRIPLPSGLPPEQALLWLREDRRPFALAGDWYGGLTVLGSEPIELADHRPFAALDGLPAIGRADAAVGGGWVGWLGYGLGAEIERLPPGPPRPVVRPRSSLAFYDHVVVFDGGQWWFEALWTDERAGELRSRLALWEERLRTAPAPAADAAPTAFALVSNGARGHLAAVADCTRRIEAGELFQANLCVRLEARFDGDPLDLFARALPAARPRFGACVDGVVSLSPERFLRRDGRRVWTEPIKGTRPRVGAPDEDRAALGELEASRKDAAEHVMIVDLMRNDLGRVCEYGTIAAEPPRAEPHAGVWHLVSTVSGRLRDGVGDGELLRATFPPGSVTGAPKVQAMKVIAALEATGREAYTGAIGMASPVAGLDLSVAIRTFELQAGRIWLGAGGGIVADSDPEAELAEALAKAAGPVAAIGGRIEAERSGRAVAAPRALGPRPDPALAVAPRPDPALGVFETVLVEDGEPVRLAEHLARLAASVDELYGARLDAATEARAREAAAPADRARLRILADPEGSTTLTATPESAAEPTPVVLTPFELPGGLGAHKWRDRRLLDALAQRAPGTVPLLVDTNGDVLEAAHANVWIVEGGTLVTPPADGRLLPGVTRASMLANARQEPIDLPRLTAADALFLTSSISGRHTARLVQPEPSVYRVRMAASRSHRAHDG